MKIFTTTDLTGYGADADNDARVIRQIERRALDLMWQLDKLQSRHEKRLVKFEKHSGIDAEIQYSLKELNC